MSNMYLILSARHDRKIRTEWMSTDSGDSVTFPSAQVFHLTNGKNDTVFGVRLWEVRTSGRGT